MDIRVAAPVELDRFKAAERSVHLKPPVCRRLVSLQRRTEQALPSQDTVQPKKPQRAPQSSQSVPNVHKL